MIRSSHMGCMAQSSSHMRTGGICKLACRFRDERLTAYIFIRLNAQPGVVLQDNGASVGFALAGGIFLVLGNIGTQYALAYCGLSITEVVSSSITVVGGVRSR